MSYQLSDIVAKVQTRVRDPSYSASEIKDYIDKSQKDVVNRWDLSFMKTTQVYTVSVGVSDITNGNGLPTYYSQAIKLINTTSGGEEVIDYIDLNDLDSMYPDHEDTTSHPNGQPLYWYYDGSTIRLFPAPDAAYTLRLRYRKRPTTLSSDTDIPVIPEEFEELLVEGGAWRVLQVKDNYDQAAIHKKEYKEQIAALVNRYNRPQSGKVQQMPLNKGVFSARTSTNWRR